MKEKRRLSLYREAKGYSQIEIAEMMSVTQQSISSWETGRTIPKPHQMKLLSEILEVDLDELFYDVFNVKGAEKENVL
ncbi:MULTISPECIES: helix-turn-helix transcriptional regulator [unclassified Enterococcus]|uniref:helix-turn-helix transcriptional regulator n=1 Tax=unclassified Enterococcus TaxID=2608891 RepID=UPI001552AEB4|nr:MULTISPECIES: helix-turn-helix transcriptional regulator [unclassified Enterococcus]MBS7577098.1 helix-turn-helix transcriptional regulator [Enterococcus sp. MMGLQ5-2]MBS7584455.1 helix-turn-helix transcriptional regulator [Enterococcus sp. MMGLQ5-1]NPD12310.1 helix-turn-helix transcriptional regulator [Enterococcus sp. MMGLQ5-1]NPD36932.1 helix-turn-helix transcriptional regulator [Enterococcus sp. MMGLQ5-2]